jgi:hypothetical protein
MDQQCLKCGENIDIKRYFYHIHRGINFLCAKCHDEMYQLCRSCDFYWDVQKMTNDKCPICNFFDGEHRCNICFNSDNVLINGKLCPECILNVFINHQEDFEEYKYKLCYICEKIKPRDLVENYLNNVNICTECDSTHVYKEANCKIW